MTRAGGRATTNVEGCVACYTSCGLNNPAAVEAVRAAATDPVASALQKVVSIGPVPVLALTIRAEVWDIQRFPTPAHLASYAGLVPRAEASLARDTLRLPD